MLAIVTGTAYWPHARSLLADERRETRRAAGVPIRVRDVVERTLQRPGFAGVMTYSLAESVWLADRGYDDILPAYPTVDAGAFRQLVERETRTAAITLMVDSVEGPGQDPHPRCRLSARRLSRFDDFAAVRDRLDFTNDYIDLQRSADARR